MNPNTFMKSMALAIYALGLSLAAAEPVAAAKASPTPAAGESSRWPAEKAWEWYGNQPWLVGFNFVPSTACNTTEWWQEETFDPATIDRELGWAQGLGFNSTRVFIQYIVWKQDPAGFKKRFDQFLALAIKHGITVMPVLFDDCTFGDPMPMDPVLGKQREPIPGMILPSWTPSPGRVLGNDPAERPMLKRYVQDMLTTFAKDSRVVVWDLFNEPRNRALVGQPAVLEELFAWAQEVRPEQPLTIGLWNGDDAINRVILAQSDVVSFHLYAKFEVMQGRIAAWKKQGRPVICSEWMARPVGSNWATDLPLFKEQGVGCYNWGLVNGRTQCQFSWYNKRGTPEPKVWFHDLFHKDGTPYDPVEHEAIRKATGKEPLFPIEHAPAPLFDDPMWHGAADPSVIWNPITQEWWIYYTQRRATLEKRKGVDWCYGTAIGIATSKDGIQWKYEGICTGDDGLGAPIENKCTWWAPCVIYNEGRFHLFVAYIDGIYSDWIGKAYIKHFTSTDGRNWKYEMTLPSASKDWIDACIYRIGGKWMVWYKERNRTSASVSSDLKEWKELGPIVTDVGHEAPFVFHWKGAYWMIVDAWSRGLRLYRSEDGLSNWQFNNTILLAPGGTRAKDSVQASHPYILEQGDRAFVFYHVHYAKGTPQGDLTVLQVAELELDPTGKITCDRNKYAAGGLPGPVKSEIGQQTGP